MVIQLNYKLIIVVKLSHVPAGLKTYQQLSRDGWYMTVTCEFIQVCYSGPGLVEDSTIGWNCISNKSVLHVFQRDSQCFSTLHHL